MQTTEFNLLDATFLNLDRQDEPWSVHLELRVAGRINQKKLEQALAAAIARHPMAHARMQPHAASATKYFWELPEAPDQIPLTVHTVKTDGEVASIRDGFVSIQVPLSLAPCFVVVLVHHPKGDYLMLNVPHTLADGLSCFRLLQSVVRHYAGLPDPAPHLDPLAVRSLQALAGSKTIAQRLERIKLLLEHLGKSRTAPVRIAALAKATKLRATLPGYRAQLLTLSKAETKRFMARRQKPATVNDMLIAGMAQAIKSWNAQQGLGPGRIATIMPVNLRPEAWWYEVLGNFSSYVSISLSAAEQGDFNSTMAAVCAQSTAFKEAGAAGTLIDLLDVPRFLPAFLKGRLKELFPLFGKTLMETTWVSNLGRLEAMPEMGDAGKVTDVFFTPPAPMPCSIAIGIACMDDQLLIGLRYRNSQFDEAATLDFARLLKTTLLGE